MARTFSIFDVKSPDGSLLPIVVFDAPNGSVMSADLLRYAKFLQSRGDSFARIRAACRSIGLLHDFYVCAYGRSVITAEAIPSLIARFLMARRNGTVGHDGADSTNLGWLPAGRQTVAMDRYYLAEYSDFCVRHGGGLPLGPTIYPEEARLHALNRLRRGRIPRQGDLLDHIADRRKGPPIFAVDISERQFGRPARRRAKQYPKLDAVNAMIDSAESIVQKMLLIEGFFGGPRLSEMLHKWQCDILPGRLRKSVFPDDACSSVPLLIHAHPSQSTFVGGEGRYGEDRGQVLRNKYGLTARHLIDPDPFWTGWKGMSFDEPARLVSQVFWADFERADEYYALFKRLRSEIWPMVPDRVRNSHPYLYINDCPHQAEFGQPMKLSNARKVFQRAAARVGLDADYFRDGSHASRHFYKAALRRLKLSDDDIQRCMHHVWKQSQEAYGRSIRDVHEALNAALPPKMIEGSI